MFLKYAKKTQILIVLAVFVFGTLIFFGCEKEPKVIKIGAVLPLTGAAQLIGEWVKNGMTLAVEQINEEGGVRGKKLELVFEDNKTSPKDAVSALNKLINVDKISVFISAQNATAASVVPVADSNKVVGFFVVANQPGLPDMSEWAFRYHVHGDTEAEIMAQYAVKRFQLKNAALFYINDEYGISSGKAFRKSFEGLGGKIVAEDSFEKTGIDFRASVLKLKEANPEAIYIVGYERSLGIAVKQIRELEIKSILLSNNGFTVPAYLKLMGGAGEGAYCTAPTYALHTDYPEAKNFIQAYEAKFGGFGNFMAAEGYDAIILLTEAIKKGGGSSADSIRRGLLQIKEFDAAMGKISILPNGEVDLPTEIGVVKGLELVKVEGE